MAEHPYVTTLRERFGGVISAGLHEPGPVGSVLEIESVARGRAWSDEPITLPDLRPLNDALNDRVRTERMLPLVISLWDWAEWSNYERVRFARTLSALLIRRVLPGRLRAAAGRCELDHKQALKAYAADAAAAAASISELADVYAAAADASADARIDEIARAAECVLDAAADDDDDDALSIACGCVLDAAATAR